MGIRFDIIDGAQVSEDRDGFVAVRVALVDGLAGSTTARCHEALQLQGMPKRGDPHPSIPDLLLDQRTAQPVSARDRSKVRVTLTYRQLTGEEAIGGPPQIELGTTLTTRTTSRDNRGLQTVISHVVEDLDDEGNIIQRRTEEQIPTFQVTEPMLVYTVRQREATNPIGRALGAINRIGFFGSARWMCTRIESSSDDGGVTFLTAYEFTYRPAGWLVPVEPVDRTTGEPVKGAPVALIAPYEYTRASLPVPPPTVDLPSAQEIEAAARG